MKHGHLFGNHPPRTQSLAEAGACTPAAQGFGAAVVTIHETQGIAFHPEHGRLSPSSSESHRLDSMGDDAFNIENPNQLEFEFGENEDEVDEEDANSLVDEVEQFLRDQDSN